MMTPLQHIIASRRGVLIGRAGMIAAAGMPAAATAATTEPKTTLLHPVGHKGAKA